MYMIEKLTQHSIFERQCIFQTIIFGIYLQFFGGVKMVFCKLLWIILMQCGKTWPSGIPRVLKFIYIYIETGWISGNAVGLFEAPWQEESESAFRVSNLSIFWEVSISFGYRFENMRRGEESKETHGEKNTMETVHTPQCLLISEGLLSMFFFILLLIRY